MPNLYELLGDYERLQKACYDTDSPGEIEALLEAIDEAKGSLNEKVDNIARLLSNLKADAEKIKTHEERLARRRKTFERSVERLREWVQSSMDILDVDQIKTPLHTATLSKKVPVKVVVTDIDKVPEEYKKRTVDVDKKAVLRAYSNDGEIIDGTNVIEGKRMLVIR